MELMNALPLLSEIQHALEALRERGEERVFNLTQFPLTNDDSRLLDETLGRGNITINYQGVEHTFWQEAKIAGVWWGEYRNVNGHVALRTVEVTYFPALAKSQPEDIDDGQQRIADALQATTFAAGMPVALPISRDLPVLSNAAKHLM